MRYGRTARVSRVARASRSSRRLLLRVPCRCQLHRLRGLCAGCAGGLRVRYNHADCTGCVGFASCMCIAGCTDGTGCISIATFHYRAGLFLRPYRACPAFAHSIAMRRWNGTAVCEQRNSILRTNCPSLISNADFRPLIPLPRQFRVAKNRRHSKLNHVVEKTPSNSKLW